MQDNNEVRKPPREWWIMQWEPLAGADNAWRNEKFCDLDMKDHLHYPHRSAAEKIHVREILPGDDSIRVSRRLWKEFTDAITEQKWGSLDRIVKRIEREQVDK